MRVLIDADCGRIGEGLASSLFWVPEMEVMTWFASAKPAMDMFDETNPDILIVKGQKLNSAEIKIASSRYPNTRLISIGAVEDNIISPHLSLANPKQANKFPSIPFFGGAMLGAIGNAQENVQMESEVLCITDYLDLQKEENLEYLKFVCENYNAKFFGLKRVPFASYLGTVTPAQKASSIASTSVYLDLDGESWHDAAWLGKEVVSVSENSLNHFSGMEDLEEKIDFCLSRKGSATNEIKATVVNATYFDLSYELLNFLGFSNEAMFLQQKKKELLC